MSKTPKTDEFLCAECCDLEHLASFTRQLERELSEASKSPYIDSDEQPVEILAAIYDALDGITDDAANGQNFGTLVSRVKWAVSEVSHLSKELATVKAQLEQANIRGDYWERKCLNNGPK